MSVVHMYVPNEGPSCPIGQKPKGRKVAMDHIEKPQIIQELDELTAILDRDSVLVETRSEFYMRRAQAAVDVARLRAVNTWLEELYLLVDPTDDGFFAEDSHGFGEGWT